MQAFLQPIKVVALLLNLICLRYRLAPFAIEVKWIKYMLKSRKLSENIKPAFKSAVAKATENETDASSSEVEESNKEEKTIEIVGRERVHLYG